MKLLQSRVTAKSIAQKRWLWMSVGAAVLFCVAHSVVGVLKLRWLGYGWNMALYEQEIWNGAHGRFFATSLWGESHSQLGLDLFLTQLLYIPFYMLGGQTTESLIILQNIAIGIGCWPIYQLGRQILKRPWGGFIAVLCYVLLPAVSFLANREFDPRSFSMVALLFAAYAYHNQQMPLFIGACLFALASKSDMAFPVLGFMLIALVERRGIRWAVVPFGLATGWLVMSLYIVIPLFSHTSSFQDIAPSYGYLGNSAGEILRTVITRPLYTIQALWNNAATLPKMEYILALLAPFGGLVLLGWRWLIPALPTFLFNFFSTSSNQWDIRTRHQAALIPFLCIAALYGLAVVINASNTSGARFRTRYGVGILIGVLVCANVIYKNPLISTLRYHESAARVAAAREIIAQVPPDASVSATAFLVPYLARREEVQIFERMVLDPTFVSLYPFPPEVEYFVGDRRTSPEEEHAINVLQQDAGWQTLDEREGFILLQNPTFAPPNRIPTP